MSHTQPPTTDPSQTYIDPTATLAATSCLDFLLIELVPMAYRITNDLAAREEAFLHGTTSSSTSKPHADSSAMDNDASSTIGQGGGGGGGGGSGVGVGGGGTAGTVVDEEEAREAVFHRLEALGYRVGLGVVERFSRDKPRPTTPLDTIKFLCKDLWMLLFRKQIDNLKTNHRGIYVLTDNAFKPLSRMSFDTKKFDAATHALVEKTTGDPAWGVAGRDNANTVARVQPFLYFPAGIVRGCLAALGVMATVTAETAGPPVATFQIRTVGAKP